MVDDNYDYMALEKRTTHGEFETWEKAVEACKKIVNEWLETSYKPGMSAEELRLGYKSYGLDPFIIGAESKPFSAWEYAEQRCAEICSKR